VLPRTKHQKIGAYKNSTRKEHDEQDHHPDCAEDGTQRIPEADLSDQYNEYQEQKQWQ
jgi:hypothetical protein